MKFNSPMKHKTKPKLLTLILSLLLMFSMLAPMFISQPLDIYAGYDGTEGEAGGQYGEGNIGASFQNTGEKQSNGVKRSRTKCGASRALCQQSDQVRYRPSGATSEGVRQ